MKTMEIRLLAFDLDGTLLDRQSRLPAENRAAVARAMAAGLEVILVTGRSWRATRPYYAELGLTGPTICYLGALVVADGSGRILRHRPLEPAAWEALRGLALAGGLSLVACVGADQAVEEGRLGPDLVAADVAYATCRAPDFLPWEDWNPYTEMAPDLAPCTGAPTMAAVYGDRAVRRVLAAFPDGLPHSQFDLTDKVAGETVLHIWHETVDKGRALAAYCRRRGIRPEQVAAFGDAGMDAPMLAFAGVGVAMPWGDEQALSAARWLLPPAEAVDRILAGRTAG